MAIKLPIVLMLLVISLPIAIYAATPVTTGVGLNIVLTNYDPSPAQPGKYVKLYLKAENSGGSVLNDATFQLQPTYPFSLKPDENATRYMSAIGAQEQVLLEYNLYVDKNAIAGTYAMHIKLCLDSECSSYLRTPFDVSVQTGGTPKIEAGLDSADVFSSGKKGFVTLHVLNRGLLDTKFLVVEARPSEQYDIISPPRLYIGELKSDDYETVQYEIYIRENVASKQSEKIAIPVLLEYSDLNDKEYSEIQDIGLNVYSQDDLAKMGIVKNNSGTLMNVAFVILGIFVLFMLYKKFKKRKSSS